MCIRAYVSPMQVLWLAAFSSSWFPSMPLLGCPGIGSVAMPCLKVRDPPAIVLLEVAIRGIHHYKWLSAFVLIPSHKLEA